MTGDEQFPEPSPVAEYRDPELVRRFEQEPVPQHGAGFWSELEARLGLARAEGGGTDVGSEATVDEDEPTVLIQLLATEAPVPAGGNRWGTGRWLAAAAAVLAILGLGGAALIAQGRSSSPVSSAAPASDESDDGEAEAEDPSPSSTPTTAGRTTTTTEPTFSTTTAAAVADPVVDYFGDARFNSIGPGRVVAFAPDDSAVLVVDDAPGVASGCEGAELLALYTQDLATGHRRPTMADDAVIETGGLELVVDPFGATPGEVGTRPVYGKEWCDGVPNALWRGVLASDGQISGLEPVAIGTEDDPFSGRSGGVVDGSSIVSPDGRHVLVASGDTAGVLELDTDGDAADDTVLASLPENLGVAAIRAAAWSPDGQAVALSTDESLLLWSPWTGASQRFDGGARTLIFDGSGGRLAVDDGADVIVLTFGDRPEPVSAPPRCSGRIDLAPLTTAALTGQGLPKNVATTVVAIDEAASTCDWVTLDRLTPDDFVSSLGGSDPVAFWQAEEAAGTSPMWYLRTLFRQTNAVETGDGDGVHIWPAIDQDDDCELDEAERASTIALGLDPAAIGDACLVTGGYTGYRTSIGADGQWRSFHLALGN